jgi:SAM-dependent methyltransferase
MPGRDEWSDIAAGDADELRERILTGYKAGKPFTPYVPTLTLPAPLESVLDFGCGLGRNFSYLKTVASRVEGYDLPPMIERCRALATEPVSDLTSDWTDARTRRYALVFASLVLQHIDTAECRRYLADFAYDAARVSADAHQDGFRRRHARLGCGIRPIRHRPVPHRRSRSRHASTSHHRRSILRPGTRIHG